MQKGQRINTLGKTVQTQAERFVNTDEQLLPDCANSTARQSIAHVMEDRRYRNYTLLM